MVHWIRNCARTVVIFVCSSLLTLFLFRRLNKERNISVMFENVGAVQELGSRGALATAVTRGRSSGGEPSRIPHRLYMGESFV